MRFAELFLLFILYSFLGWIFESAYVSVLERRPVNRGFLNGPVIPIYGAGALLVVAVFRNHSDNNISLFLSSAVLISILEYVTSWGLERMFHARWWDYSTHRFHINGRVCLDAACVFGLFSVILIRFLHPFLTAQIERMLPPLAITWIGALLLFLFLTDLTITLLHLVNLTHRLRVIQDAYDKYRKQLTAKGTEFATMISDKVEEGMERFENSAFYTATVRRLMEIRRFQDVRLLRAYPRATFLRFRDAWEKVKEQIQKRL